MHLENAGNPFAGELGPEVDKAWDELLIGNFFFFFFANATIPKGKNRTHWLTVTVL